jgi:hypothetical protein
VVEAHRHRLIVIHTLSYRIAVAYMVLRQSSGVISIFTGLGRNAGCLRLRHGGRDRGQSKLRALGGLRRSD